MVLRKHLTKLIAAGVLILVAGILLTLGTFAWYVISTDPEVAGVTVVVGGRNSILVAPDVNSAGLHYPGRFDKELDLSSFVAPTDFEGLLPVSTSDGKTWWTLLYDLDTNSSEYVAAEKGWLELDFWMVAPSADYTVRVSTGTKAEDESKSFALVLPEIALDEDGNYVFAETKQNAAASLRVGFLTETGTDASAFEAYKTSSDKEDQFITLHSLPSENDRFAVYEPNGDLHPGQELSGYVPTAPHEGALEENQLTVQKSALLDMDALSQRLPLTDADKSHYADLDGDVTAEFYRKLWMGQKPMSLFVRPGLFYQTAADLSPAEGAAPKTAGAAEDAFVVELKANEPQLIRMFVWLEGEDVDCSNDACNARIYLQLEFAGYGGMYSS